MARKKRVSKATRAKLRKAAKGRPRRADGRFKRGKTKTPRRRSKR